MGNCCKNPARQKRSGDTEQSKPQKRKIEQAKKCTKMFSYKIAQPLPAPPSRQKKPAPVVDKFD